MLLALWPSPNLFVTTRPSMRPFSTVAFQEDYLNSLKNMTCQCLQKPSLAKTLDRGVINLEGGASAPPLNPPLLYKGHLCRRPLSCYIHLVSYRWLHNIHMVKCKHPIPITYTIRNNLDVKLELYH